ncbi:MAG: prepilin-type N-terminal cleavage/methylation domain-containing protein [Verrucomicrobiota bacterium]
MKARNSLSSRRGFSMIELMTVIAIMVILAGILIGALPGIQAKVSRNKVETFMAELSSGLSRYQLDNGLYPQNPLNGGERDEVGVEGSKVLYKHLSGDRGGADGSGSPDGFVDEDETIYVQNLSYEQNKESKDPRADSIGSEYFLIDAFGNPIRYLAEPPNVSGDKRETYNPTYDLWSITDADPKSPEEQARHITNWQSN